MGEERRGEKRRGEERGGGGEGREDGKLEVLGKFGAFDGPMENLGAP